MTIIKKSDVKNHSAARSKRLLFAVQSKSEAGTDEPTVSESSVEDLEKMPSLPVAPASENAEKENKPD
jgi:hypothetical protein